MIFFKEIQQMRLIVKAIVRNRVLNVEIMILQTGLPDQLIPDQKRKTLAADAVKVQKFPFHPAFLKAEFRRQIRDRQHALALDNQLRRPHDERRYRIRMLMRKQKRFPLRPQRFQTFRRVKRLLQPFRPAGKIEIHLILRIPHGL